MNVFKRLVFGFFCLITMSVFAVPDEDFDAQLLVLQQEWAKVNYTLKEDDQEKAFKELISKIDVFVERHPDKAEPLIWQGIIKSSFAGAKGGLGALSLAKEAKASLEQALKINDMALDGSAYTSLGTLYHKVPGWPIAFGDDDDAKILLEKAIKINPEGIDPNYFYGEFLYDEGEYEKAKNHLTLAMNAPPRAARKLADESRKLEVQQLLVKVDKRLNRRKRH